MGINGAESPPPLGPSPIVVVYIKYAETDDF